MTSWKELDIDIPTKIFVEVFTNRAAPLRYTHQMLLALTDKKSRFRQRCVDNIKTHTRQQLSIVWEALVQQNPSLQKVKNLAVLKKRILESLSEIQFDLNFTKEANALLSLLNQSRLGLSMPILEYLSSVLGVALKLSKKADGFNHQEAAVWSKKIAPLLKRTLWKEMTEIDYYMDRSLMLCDADPARWGIFVYAGIVSMLAILYAVYDLITQSESHQVSYGLLAGVVFLNISIVANIRHKTQRNYEVNIIFKDLSPSLKNKIKHSLLKTLQSLAPRHNEHNSAILYTASQNKSRQPSSITSVTQSGDPSQSIYFSYTEGQTLSSKKQGKQKEQPIAVDRNTEHASSTLVAKPTQWDFNGSNEFNPIALTNSADIYPLSIHGGTQYLFWDLNEMASNAQAKALQHIVQDGKTISIYSKGKNGIKVYSTEADDKRKEASAVVKVSDQRIYCRAVNARLSSGENCVIHIPVIAAKKDQYKAFIRACK